MGEEGERLKYGEEERRARERPKEEKARSRRRRGRIESTLAQRTKAERFCSHTSYGTTCSLFCRLNGLGLSPIMF